MSPAESITAAKGGTWHRTYGLMPGPGHSARDRSIIIRDLGDDITVHSFAGEDWRAVRDALKGEGLLPPRAEPPSLAERHRQARERRAAEAARTRADEARHLDAKHRAEALWGASSPVSCAHPYLTRKGLGAHGLCQHNADLIVPIRDPDGHLWTVQRIAPHGGKRYLPGGRVKGNCWSAGLVGDAGVILIGEGWATCAALHEATGHQVAAAMDAGNMGPVALAMRAKYPAAKIILCADIDPNGVGEAKATAAARSVMGMVARPPRPRGWDETRALDFADVWAVPGGADAIRATFGGLL